MTAIGIRAAASMTQAGSFVSVKMSQISVSDNKDFGSLLSQRLNSASAASETRTYSDIKLQKTEYSKESTPVQPKDTAADAASQVKESVQNTSGTNDNTMSAKSTEGTRNEDLAETSEAGKNVSAETKTDETAGVIKTDAADSQDAAAMTEEEKNGFIKAMEVMNTLLQHMAQMLETTVNSLQGSFDELNIEPQNMFDTVSIQTIVITYEELGGVSDLLVNDDALSLFNDLREAVENVFSQADFTMDEYKEAMGNDKLLSMIEFEVVKLEETAAKSPLELISRIFEQMTGRTPGSEFKAVKNEADILKNGELNLENAFENADEELSFKVQSGDADFGSETENEQNSLFAKGERTVQAAGRRAISIANEPTGIEGFIQNLERAGEVLSLDTPVMQGTTVRDIVFQLVDAIKVEITPETRSLEMQLNPENLGRVSLNIESKGGVMTAHITTENQISKEALESQLQILKENIESQGIRVEAIEVTVSSFSFMDSKNAESDPGAEARGNSGTKRIGGQNSDEEEPAVQAEAQRLEREVMEQTGSTVSYTA